MAVDEGTIRFVRWPAAANEESYQQACRIPMSIDHNAPDYSLQYVIVLPPSCYRLSENVAIESTML